MGQHQSALGQTGVKRPLGVSAVRAEGAVAPHESPEPKAKPVGRQPLGALR